MKERNHPRPFSLRLTQKERTALEVKAGDQPLGAYIRSQLLSEQQSTGSRNERRAALAQILAKLGQSEITPSLRELAHHARYGALPLMRETEEAIQRACVDIAEIKSLLMKALRIKED